MPSIFAAQALLHPTAEPFESKGPFNWSGPIVHAELLTDPYDRSPFGMYSQLATRSTGHPALEQFTPFAKVISMGRLKPSTMDTGMPVSDFCEEGQRHRHLPS